MSSHPPPSYAPAKRRVCRVKQYEASPKIEVVLGAIEMAQSEYEIHVRGRVSDEVLSTFEGMAATARPTETVLRGSVRDQAALHGLLDRIQSLGLELIEVRRSGENS